MQSYKIPGVLPVMPKTFWQGQNEAWVKNAQRSNELMKRVLL